jgi:nicotinate-nucleotide pyrophosphorylase (carboxylating)
MNLTSQVLRPMIEQWLAEDDLNRNIFYLRSLPKHLVAPELKIKSPLVLAGVDYFMATFEALGANQDWSFLRELEGHEFKAGTTISFPFKLPFNVAVNAERLALNLLQHASSIATYTKKFTDKTKPFGIKVLDTRKTTPGLRALEKYAVRLGGGFNHRFGQVDTWMIKDNHKTSLGGLAAAWTFFEAQGAYYNNTVVEIHDLAELKLAVELGVQNVMLDNFHPQQVLEAVVLKKPGMTFEISGGIRLDTIENYCLAGVDAISIGALTSAAPKVDISLKYKT